MAKIQHRHVVARALTQLARDHDLVISYGNSPQLGSLAPGSVPDPVLPPPYPLDVPGAQSEAMFGYFLLQALENALPGQQVARLFCQTLVAQHDPAFEGPTTFVGPSYGEEEARRLARLHGWQICRDDLSWRRVVPSPDPQALVELPTIRSLLGDGAVVCARAGIPACRDLDGQLHNVEAVVDNDLTAAMLARQLGADVLLLLTDVATVELDPGADTGHPLRRLSAPRCAPGRSPLDPLAPSSTPPAGSWRPRGTRRSSARRRTQAICSRGEGIVAEPGPQHALAPSAEQVMDTKPTEDWLPIGVDGDGPADIAALPRLADQAVQVEPVHRRERRPSPSR